MTNPWDGIAQWFSQDARTDFVSTNISELKLPLELMEVYKDTTAYQGFDVLQVLDKMKNESVKCKKTDVITLKYTPGGGNEVSVVFDKSSKVMQDVAFLIFLFATRGSSWEKIKKKSTDKMSKIMTLLESKYDINTEKRTGDNDLGPSDVTIPRIAACFPMLVCDYYHEGYGKPLVSLGELGLTNAISSSLLCNAFASLIPDNLAGHDRRIHYVSFYVHVKVDKVIHRQDKKYTALPQIFTYYQASYNTPAVPTSIDHKGTMRYPRAEYLEKRGFMAAGKIINVLQSDVIVTKMKSLIKLLRPDVDEVEFESVMTSIETI